MKKHNLLKPLILALSFNILAVPVADARPKKQVAKTVHQVKRTPRQEAFVARPQSNTGRYAAIVIDANGKVLYEQGGDKLLYAASTTKIMTARLVFEALKTGKLKLDQILTVSDFAAKTKATNLNLREGATITVRDALSALLVHSANDMAVVFAEAISGSQEAFAVKMNAEAAKLKLDMHYENPNGLPNANRPNANGIPDDSHKSDPNNKSTVGAMAELARLTLRDYPEYAGFFNLPTFKFGNASYKNYNTLLGKFPGADCCKTGYINASGYNLIASAKDAQGRRVFAGVYGSPNPTSRARDVSQLLTFGFKKLDNPAAVFNPATIVVPPAPKKGAAAPAPEVDDEEGAEAPQTALPAAKAAALTAPLSDAALSEQPAVRIRILPPSGPTP